MGKNPFLVELGLASQPSYDKFQAGNNRKSSLYFSEAGKGYDALSLI